MNTRVWNFAKGQQVAKDKKKDKKDKGSKKAKTKRVSVAKPAKTAARRIQDWSQIRWSPTSSRQRSLPPPLQ